MTPHVETLDPCNDLDLAETIMRLDQFRHLPVVDGGRLVGMVSQRDLLRHAARHESEQERRIANLHIRTDQIMTTDVRTVRPETPVREALATMRGMRVGSLPVVDAEECLVGIVTETDMLDLLSRLL
ncbi:MAG: CBS domain-containing protein [Myxococcota bacterium]